MPQTSRKTVLYALLLLPLALVIMFAPVIFGGKTLLPADQLNTMMLPYSAKHDSVRVFNHFLTDAIAQVYPYKVRWRENALKGEFASWNPMILGGHPHYASTSFTHFDPTNLVLLLGEMPAAYHAQMLVKLLIAGVGMWLLLGIFHVAEARIHPLLRALFAMAYMLNSLFVTTLQHQWLVGAFCWVPWALTFLLLFVRGEKRGRNAALSSLFLAFACLGGSLQTAAIAIMAFVIVGASAMLPQASSSPESSSPKVSWKKRYIRAALALTGIGALAFALSAVMWLPSLELFLYNENIRAAGKAFSIGNSLKSLPLLISFVIPELIGTPRGFDIAKIAQADMNDFNAFIGFAPWLFGIFGCFTLWKRGSTAQSETTRWARGFIMLAALGLLIPLATPLYKFIYHRSFILYVLGMTVVGALAAQEVFFGSSDASSSAQMRQKKILRFAAWGLALVAIGLLAGNIVLAWKYDLIYNKVRSAVESNMGNAQLAGGSRAWMLGRVEKFLHHYSWHNPMLWFALIAPAGAFILVWRMVAGKILARQRLWAMTALFAVTALQLWGGIASWLPMVDMERYPLYASTQTTDFLRRDSALHRFLPLFDAASHRVMQPNINDMYGIACVQGYESIFARNASLLGGTLSQPPLTQEILIGGLANLKYYVASAKNPYTHPALQLVDSGATLIYRNLLAEDRAYMRYRYRVVDGGREPRRIVSLPKAEAFMRLLANDSTFAKHEVLFAEEPSVKIMRDDSQIPHHIRFLSYENNRVRLEVETAGSGYLVLADSYYAGWKAFVNGTESPIQSANYVLRSVVVPQGKSIIEFRFEPVLVRLGGWISLSACILCFALIILQRRK
jgi:hypothetical protein